MLIQSTAPLPAAVVKGTHLVQAPKLQPPKERKLQARLSAFLGDARLDAGAVMHAVSVTSWLTDAEPEARTPRAGDGAFGVKVCVYVGVSGAGCGGARRGGKSLSTKTHLP